MPTAIANDIKHGKTVDHLGAQIRSMILNGEFAPGQRLVMRDLMEELNVSHGPLREAFRHLAAQGLIEIIANRGAVVRKLNRREILDLFRIREALEGLAARLAAENIENSPHRKNLEQVAKATTARDQLMNARIYVTENKKFHDAIVRLADNPQLTDLLDKLGLPVVMLQLRLAMTTAQVEASMHEHQQIAAAVLEGNPDKADRAMRAHLRRSVRDTLAQAGSSLT
ncbi:DNA-binding GntR family transcriptional regulator [Rhodoligotrophos appendicifer]|uniref:GntR family transcriptional regulator n=1 Tax=Rhodoligotrophos appendicifer TaxID=987056 RepID=UPI0014794194|nr:GntR family transcriptional regulator [Rhodoligotrophos appendicifer]